MLNIETLENMSDQKHQVKTSSSNFGAKGWLIIIFSFLCILLDSSLINDSLNVVLKVFVATRGWSLTQLYAFSSICSFISVLGAAMWGYMSNKTSIRLTWAETEDFPYLAKSFGITSVFLSDIARSDNYSQYRGYITMR